MSLVSPIYSQGEPEETGEEFPELHIDNRELAELVVEAIRRTEDAKLEGAAANAKKAEARANLEVRGIPKESFKWFVQYLSWPPEKREQNWQALYIMRRWCEEPPQRDLFEDLTAGD